jgi:hypothetical protein
MGTRLSLWSNKTRPLPYEAPAFKLFTGFIVDDAFACGGGCFPAGTLVTTASGAMPIDQLAVGDVVIGVDQEGILVPRHVTTVFTHPNNVTLDLVTDASTIRTTFVHPMWMGGDVYRRAGDLKPGDRIMRCIDGVMESSTVIALKHSRSIETVYNIEVEDTHTYIANGYVVHNLKS